ncbi:MULTISPECIES: hypothetical protein [unclassified Burkholderia]|uniref:hypothetical protein n=1 Tax=unclassified Burkholderia TaxID=2613784 RepID=UPI002012A5B7|nr:MULTISPECIES: hypothetical protein [unclassified Burkholderia]
MSKGTIRLPQSAIAGGRIGTARVSGIASGLGLPVAEVAAAIAAAPAQPSPIERMQQLGRLPKGRMNKTEAAYADVLAARLHAGEILWFRFEALKLRLADKTFITIDFPVITAGGALEFHEVKGRWTDDARAKTKMAAEQFPFRFLAIQRDGRHGWRVEDLTGRSW